MNTKATFKFSDGTEFSKDYLNTCTVKGENAMLRDLAKVKNADRSDSEVKLSVSFEEYKGAIILDPAKIHQTEKRQILARIGKLTIDDLRAIDLIYC